MKVQAVVIGLCVINSSDIWIYVVSLGLPMHTSWDRKLPFLTYSILDYVQINRLPLKYTNGTMYIDQSRTRVIGAMIFIEAVNIYKVLNVWYYLQLFVAFFWQESNRIHWGNNKIYWVKKHYMEMVGRWGALKYIKNKCQMFSVLPSQRTTG